MSDTAIRLTYDDYLLLPDDGRRHEIIEGEYYVNAAPNPWHQRISLNFVVALGSFLRVNRLGRIYPAPIDVVLSNENVVQPDVVFVSSARETIITERNIQGAPDLVIEILSAGTRKLDERHKLKLYEGHGVSEYWIVDPDREVVVVFRRGADGFERLGDFEGNAAITSPLLPGFAIELREIFA